MRYPAVKVLSFQNVMQHSGSLACQILEANVSLFHFTTRFEFAIW